MNAIVTLSSRRVGMARQLVYNLTPTIGLTRVGNRLSEESKGKKINVEVQEHGFIVDGRILKGGKHLANRLYCHGVDSFELKGVPRQTIKDAFRKIIKSEGDFPNVSIPSSFDLRFRDLTEKQINDFANMRSYKFQEAIDLHPKTPRKILFDHAKGGSMNAYNRIKATLTPEELDDLANSNNSKVKDAVIAHPNTPRKTLLGLAKSGVVTAFKKVEDSLASDELTDLVNSSSQEIQSRTLLHPKIAKGVLIKFLVSPREFKYNQGREIILAALINLFKEVLTSEEKACIISEFLDDVSKVNEATELLGILQDKRKEVLELIGAKNSSLLKSITEGKRA